MKKRTFHIIQVGLAVTTVGGFIGFGCEFAAAATMNGWCTLSLSLAIFAFLALAVFTGLNLATSNDTDKPVSCKSCPSCNTANDLDAVYCKHCGKKF